MVFRELKEKINILTNLLMKSNDISKDKRITQKPAFDMYFQERPGIRHPEITPSLPLLQYVHNNSPSIKVATMRLRETIFRRGFEWERKFEAKCKDCNEEYEDVINQCESCGSINIDIPNKNELKRADDFFETCTIYDRYKAGKRKLVHLLKEIEDDLQIFDDGYLIGIKEYWQDNEGDIKLTSLHQIVRGNPVVMRIVADEKGDPGGKWATCLRHRDIIEDIVDNNIDNLKCKKCNRKLYEVHYVSVEGGGDQPSAYYISDEVIHVSKYHPSALYGFSPIVTLWQTALTLTNMTEYIYRAYSEAHLPKGVLAMKTSNPDSAYEFWKDVDDKLQKDKHYIPKMFLEGEGNGSGSGMEFVKFMDTLEEMQYIPVRDEIRRTIAALYGVTNIFIGDTSGVGGMNSESTQIDITNMAAESGISIYNDYIMPEILSWLGIKDWEYVLQSPFEENKQRELNENQSQVQIAQSMLQMGFDIQLGEEDIFEFKYSGEAKKQDQQSPFNMPQNNFGKNPDQGEPKGNEEVAQNTPGMNENDLKMSIEKSRVYVKHPNEAPKGVKIERSSRGSYFYDKVEQKHVPPQRPNEATLSMDKKRRIETLLQQTNEHYENILEEYKHTKDLNPGHAMSLTADLQETRNLISSLHRNYRELFGDQPKVEKESEGRNVNINIQKYAGEDEDIYQMKKFKKELNAIFEEEIQKIMNSSAKFSGEDIKIFTKKCLDDAIYKMNLKTKRFITQAYASGQEYVGNLVKQSIDFRKIDREAIDAILNKHVLWESYENLSKSTSDQFNTIITEGFADPKTFSVANLVNKMREVADAETYRLEKISRTEVHVAAMKGREVSFQKTDVEGTNKYFWAVRHDSRTSKTCLDIEKQVEIEGNGKGVTLQRLNEIIKEISLRDNGSKWQYRDFQPHISCRSGIVRMF